MHVGGFINVCVLVKCAYVCVFFSPGLQTVSFNANVLHELAKSVCSLYTLFVFGER